MKHTKPNIVMIMADQFVFNAIGALGHPVVQTPNIDRLVQSGVTFENCYCNSPICVPARASLLSGKHIGKLGVYDNGSELPAGVPTFVHHLRRGGYETVLSGKMHFIGPDQLHGFEHRLTKDVQPSSFALTPDWSKGVYANPGTGVKRLKQSNVCEWNKILDYDEKVLHRALEQIRAFSMKKDQDPFFLCASFFHPHDPFEITEEFWDMYRDHHIALPDVPAEPLDDMHPFNQWIQIHHEIDTCELTEEEIVKNRRAYYGMITYFDHKIGQIIDELERKCMMENTIIVVTSDHGEMLGEHGMWFKRTFYDQATKVPLIMSFPDHYSAGKRVNKIVSLADLSATLMKIGDVPECDDWISELDGDSFESLLFGDDENWKDEAICEYYGEGPIQPMVMLRKGRYKYVYVHEHEPLLFDMEKDPYEVHNLAQLTEYKHSIDEFQKRIATDFDMERIRKDVIHSQQERIMVAESLQIGEKTSWDHKPRD
jgi:choline-sulfatase